MRRLRTPATDLVLLAIATVIVQVVSPTGSPTGRVPDEPLLWSIGFSLLVFGVCALRGMFSPPARLELLEEFRLVISVTALAATIVMTGRVFFTNEPYVAAEIVRHWIVMVPLLAAGRTALLLAEADARRKGRAGWPTLIVGAGRVGQLTARRLLEEPELGLRPVGFLDEDPLDVGEGSTGLPIFGAAWDLEKGVAEYGVRHVIITFSTAPHETLLSIARRCWQLGVTVAVVPRLFEIEGQRVTTEHLGGLPLVGVRPSNPDGWRFAVKYLVDRLTAGVALLLTLPLTAFVAAVVWISMGRPIFYRQRRVGRDGHEFDMVKFRTMRQRTAGEGEADADWALAQLSDQDDATAITVADRYTPVGRFLRRFSLDEFPQLWNVLKGDMSLIGPRPERAGYAERFEESIYRYSDRHRVKSGLTGWAQVNGLRGKTSLADRVEWDNYYIENWSLWLDFKILMRTVGCLLRGHEEPQAS